MKPCISKLANECCSPVFCVRGTAAPDFVALTTEQGVFHLSTEPCHAGDLFPPEQTTNTQRERKRDVSTSLVHHISGRALECMNSLLG